MPLNPTKTCVDCGGPVGRYCNLRCRNCSPAYIGRKLRNPANNTNPSGFCKCGCGETTKLSRHGCHRDYINGHRSRMNRVNVITAERYSIDPRTHCWNWLGAGTSTGHGMAKTNGRHVMAHRWAYELWVGPIPENMEIHHKCKNRRCINPAHLQALTYRHHRREHGVKLTIEDAREIRRRRGRQTQCSIAVEFGVSQAVVSAIQLGKVWKE